MHMEGQSVTIRDMGITTPTRPISVGAEFTGVGTTREGVGKPDPRNPDNKMSLSSGAGEDQRSSKTKSTSHPTEEPERTADTDQSANRERQTNAQAEEQQNADVEPPALEDNLTEEQIKDNFDRLWDQLDDATKKQFTKLFKKEEKKGQKEKADKTPLAFLRAIKLVFRIIALSIMENKIEFTGDDLNLGTTPLEGSDKIYYQNGSLIKSDESWEKFTQAVAGIGKDKDTEKGKSALTFGQFLNAVLDLNTKYTEGIMVVKKESSKEEKSAKKLALLENLISNKVTQGEVMITRMKNAFRRIPLVKDFMIGWDRGKARRS